MSPEIQYNSDMEQAAILLVREMMRDQVTCRKMAEPFENFSVVINDAPENKIAIIDVPADLAGQLGDNRVFIIFG